MVMMSKCFKTKGLYSKKNLILRTLPSIGSQCTQYDFIKSTYLQLTVSKDSSVMSTYLPTYLPTYQGTKSKKETIEGCACDVCLLDGIKELFLIFFSFLRWPRLSKGIGRCRYRTLTTYLTTYFKTVLTRTSIANPTHRDRFIVTPTIASL